MTEKSDIENLIIVVTNRAINNLTEKFDKRFDDLEFNLRERDRDLTDKIIARMEPMLVRYKDEAVKESSNRSAEMLKRLFNVSMDDNDEVKSLQSTMSFAETLNKSKRFILGGAIICVSLAFAVASGHGMNFLKNFGVFFLGGDK